MGPLTREPAMTCWLLTSARLTPGDVSMTSARHMAYSSAATCQLGVFFFFDNHLLILRKLTRPLSHPVLRTKLNA
jgi:hypothetical protein